MKATSEHAGPARIDAVATVEATAAIDVSRIASMSIHQVRTRLSEVAVLQARLDAEKIALNARMVSLLDDPAEPAYVVPERELMTHGSLTSREAREIAARGVVSEVAPRMAEALSQGSTSAAHLDALGRGLRMAGDRRNEFLAHLSELEEAATTMNVVEFGQLVKETAKSVVDDDGMSTLRRQQRETFLSMRTDDDGCLLIRGKFDPLSAAVISAKVGRLVESMFHSGDREVPIDVAPWVEPNDHRRAHALLALLSGSQASDHIDASYVIGGPPVRAEVIVHIDLRTLREGLHSDSVNRTSSGAEIPAETIRRLACEADIIPVVLDGRSVPIDVGRAKRLATIHQRRALEARYSTCAASGCEVSFDRCHIHHIHYWENGGGTDLSNMVPLCSRHHHAVHDGGIDVDALVHARSTYHTTPEGSHP
jgi:hypothetical protein